MKQIRLEKPGTFAAHEIPEPKRKDGDVLVRVRRIGICGTDIHAYHGRQPFFSYPRVLGHELGVEVLEASGGGDDLRPGDRCSVEPYLNCGTCPPCRAGKPNCCEALEVLGVHIDGGMQERLSLPPAKLHRANDLSFDQLALVETLGIGAHGVERAAVKAGEFVLVVGAGPIGLSVIPFALARGARVVVMDVDEQRLDFCRREGGLAGTLNPRTDTLPDALRELGGGELPAVILDATGNPASMQGAFGLVGHGGRLVFVGLYPGDITFHDPDFHRRELTLLASRNALPATFREIIDLISSGKVDTRSWITERLDLVEVPDRFEAVTGFPGQVKTVIRV